MRTTFHKTIENISVFKKQILHWANQFSECVVLDSNRAENQNQLYQTYDLIVAVEAFTSIKTDFNNAFDDLKQYQSNTNDWLFGYLSYDLKNNIENLKSENSDGLNFADLIFFQPRKVFLLKENQLEIQYLNVCNDEFDVDFSNIQTISVINNENYNLKIEAKISEENYLLKIAEMLAKINRGDIYEANFCIEFYAENAKINPVDVFEKLNNISKSPFATFFKFQNNYLMSASPERYLKKVDTKIISQPIKGTAKRSLVFLEDENLKNDLKNNPKERSENIMIVDLVRNDLSQTAIKGSVLVEELCEVYSFKQVHQLISTVVSQVAHTTSPIDILKSTFPMGSMTGAPKISAMQIIESLEETKRGLYSGSVGYFTPNGNFDFNVVIRSILYNSKNNYLSFSVGSAITANSVPENEYQECLVKAMAMFEVLS